MKLDLHLPPEIAGMHQMFTVDGKQLFVVGGAIRDAILGVPNKDIDLATDAEPNEVLAIARKNGLKSLEVGKAFGVVMINGHEIATFRKDIGSGRHPDSVEFTDLQTDTKRRDLTINALAYNITTREVIDHVGGINDLKNRIVRTVGNSADRFAEDPLRKMRALRFHARLGATFDEDTFQTLKSDPSLPGISGERIRDEFIKSIAKAKSPTEYLMTCDEIGIIKYILPELQITGPYIETNDYIILIAWILRKNSFTFLTTQLNQLKYTVKEVHNITFLVDLQNFDPSDIFVYKTKQKRTNLSNEQIIAFGSLIGYDFQKFVKFTLTVKREDLSPDLNGKEIGITIRNLESKKYLEKK